MNLDFKTSTATFVSEGLPDTTVRVLTGLNPSFAIDLGGTNHVNVPYLPQERELQLCEAFQFVSDTLGATVRGRLTSFSRGWISTAADAHHKAGPKYWGNTKQIFDRAIDNLDDAREAIKNEDMGTAESYLADAVIDIMGMGHEIGIKIPQLVEAMLKIKKPPTE